MALQKWAAPAGSPLLTTLTTTGPSTNPISKTVDYATDGDLIPGTEIHVVARGRLTTTGSPTLAWGFGALGLDPLSGFNLSSTGNTAAVAANVTNQLWMIEGRYTVNGAGDEQLYWFKTTGLFATDLEQMGVTSGIGVGATWGVVFAWDSVAADADAGDTISIEQASALWIG